MNCFPFDVECDVCGGPGVASSRVAAAQWLGEIRHSDPAVCAEYLRRKRLELDALRADVEKRAS